MREPGTARRWIGIAVRGLLLWVAVALVFWVVVLVLPGFEETSFRAALFATGMMSLLTVVLWPLVIRIVLPLTVLTFGLASLVLNAGLVMLAIEIVDGNAPSFLEALAAVVPALAGADGARPRAQLRRRRAPAQDRPPARAEGPRGEPDRRPRA